MTKLPFAKPAKRRKPRPAWNSTLPAPTKSVARKSRVKKVNVEREAKRRQRYAVKLRAYRKSETYKIVEARAGDQCECAVFPVDVSRVIVVIPSWLDQVNGVPCSVFWAARRCRNPGPFAHHHRTYARFGGGELPGDIVNCCRSCHAQLEAAHPTRKRNYARLPQSEDTR